MRPEPARRCGKCDLRIAPYDLLTVHHKTPYHQHCFLMLVREAAERREKAQRAKAGTGQGTEAQIGVRMPQQ